MALRDNPYLPLYIKDFMTDEKLAECSPSSTGIYIRLMCILHKGEEYGVFLLNQKFKQSDNQILNFASNLARHMPYDIDEIESGLSELIINKVIYIENDCIVQKRMFRDGEISIKLSISVKLGGNPNLKQGDFCLTKTSSKSEANSGIGIDNNNTDNNKKEEEDFIIKIYKMYPTKCPVRDASLSKSDKDKERIRTLMKKYSKEQIESVVKYEVESKHGKVRMYNFSTFLNNFPDPTCLFEEDETLNKNANDKYYK